MSTSIYNFNFFGQVYFVLVVNYLTLVNKNWRLDEITFA